MGLVGRSGAGKSTLIDLLTRLYRSENGEYCSMVLISVVGLPEYRSLLAYYPQDAAIFDGSLLYNLRIHNPEASLDQIVKLSKLLALINS